MLSRNCEKPLGTLDAVTTDLRTMPFSWPTTSNTSWATSSTWAGAAVSVSWADCTVLRPLFGGLKPPEGLSAAPPAAPAPLAGVGAAFDADFCAVVVWGVGGWAGARAALRLAGAERLGPALAAKPALAADE